MQRRYKPFPDPEMERQGIAAVDAGDRTTLQDRIDQLQAEIDKKGAP
jgi:hypothetical protein